MTVEIDKSFSFIYFHQFYGPRYEIDKFTYLYYYY